MPAEATASLAADRGLRRALDVLDELLVGSADAVRPSALARRLGVAPSTVTRILAGLCAKGYAARQPDGGYIVGAHVVASVLDRFGPLIQRVTPALQRLAAVTESVAQLGVLVGNECAVIACAAPPHTTVPPRQVPLWASAMGRALLAAFSPLDRLGFLPPEPFPAFTSRTATTASQLMSRMQTNESAGFYHCDEEWKPDLRSIALPVTDCPDVAALAVTSLGERRHPLRRLVVALHDEVSTLSARS